jgi:hypothetical protein
MKKEMLMVVGLVIGFCMTVQAGYKTETSVNPGAMEDQYVVKITVTEVKADGTTAVINAPAITVELNKEGMAVVLDEKEENGYCCTATVTDIKGVLTATTTIVVKANGTEVLNTTQSIKLTK